MGNAGHRAARGAALLLVGLAVAACIGGDNPGYQVIVGNKSTADLIVVMEGVGIGLPDLGGTPRKAFSVPAGTPAIAGPWVYVGFDTTGAQKPGHIRLYTSDCQAVTDFEVRGVPMPCRSTRPERHPSPRTAAASFPRGHPNSRLRRAIVPRRRISSRPTAQTDPLAHQVPSLDPSSVGRLSSSFAVRASQGHPLRPT